MLRCLSDYLLHSVTRSYNGSKFQPLQMTKSQSVDVRQVRTRHVKMLYVECIICQYLSRSVVSRFILVEADVEPVEAVEVVEIVKVLDFLEV